MTRKEATDTLIRDLNALIHYRNGVQLRDGSNTKEALYASIKGRCELIAAGVEPHSTYNHICLAADLGKLIIELLLADAPPPGPSGSGANPS